MDDWLESKTNIRDLSIKGYSLFSLSVKNTGNSIDMVKKDLEINAVNVITQLY